MDHPLHHCVFAPILQWQRTSKRMKSSLDQSDIPYTVTWDENEIVSFKKTE